MLDSFVIAFITFIWGIFLFKIFNLERSFIKNQKTPLSLTNWAWFFESKNPAYWAIVSKGIFSKFIISIVFRITLSLSLIFLFAEELKISSELFNQICISAGIFFLAFAAYINGAIQRIGNKIFSNSIYNALSDETEKYNENLLDKAMRHMERLQRIFELGERGKTQLQDVLIETHSAIIKMDKTIEVQQAMLMRIGEGFLDFQKLLKSLENRLNFTESSNDKNFESLAFITSILKSILENVSQIKNEGVEM